jgi:hypothetical protein
MNLKNNMLHLEPISLGQSPRILARTVLYGQQISSLVLIDALSNPDTIQFHPFEGETASTIFVDDVLLIVSANEVTDKRLHTLNSYLEIDSKHNLQQLGNVLSTLHLAFDEYKSCREAQSVAIFKIK